MSIERRLGLDTLYEPQLFSTNENTCFTLVKTTHKCNLHTGIGVVPLFATTQRERDERKSFA